MAEHQPSGDRDLEHGLDRRLHAFRHDLADARLEGRVSATRFTTGETARVGVAKAPIHRAPNAESERENEALFGEAVIVFDRADDWAWVQLARDDYVGYVPSDALAPWSGGLPSHVTSVPRSFVFDAPSIKSRVVQDLFLNAPLTATQHDKRFMKVGDAGYVIVDHISACDTAAPDFTRIARAFLHTPYLWGGVTHTGLDCSGLVQMSLLAAGFDCPRDTDMQAARVGRDVTDQVEHGPRQPGDLVFWPGHVAIMVDAERIIHANAHHMMVAIEPLEEAIARIKASGAHVSAVRRLSALSAATA